MEVKVKLGNLRTAPRKTRLVADLIRGKKLTEAQSILSFTINKTARDILKLINSAAATARNDFHLNESNLFVSKIMVDEGPKLKRWHPMSRGRAYSILKRTSHIVVVLKEINSGLENKDSIKKEKIEKKEVAKTVKKIAKKESIKKSKTTKKTDKK